MIEKVFLLNMKLLALLKQKLTENRDLEGWLNLSY